MAKREVKQWITVNGVHVPIYEGQSKDEAVKNATSNWSSKAKQSTEKKDTLLEEKKAVDARNFNDYVDFLYQNSHMTREEAKEYAVDNYNKGVSKRDALRNYQQKQDEKTKQEQIAKNKEQADKANNKEDADFKDGKLTKAGSEKYVKQYYGISQEELEKKISDNKDLEDKVNKLLNNGTGYYESMQFGYDSWLRDNWDKLSSKELATYTNTSDHNKEVFLLKNNNFKLINDYSTIEVKKNGTKYLIHEYGTQYNKNGSYSKYEKNKEVSKKVLLKLMQGNKGIRLK